MQVRLTDVRRADFDADGQLEATVRDALLRGWRVHNQRRANSSRRSTRRGIPLTAQFRYRDAPSRWLAFNPKLSPDDPRSCPSMYTQQVYEVNFEDVEVLRPAGVRSKWHLAPHRNARRPQRNRLLAVKVGAREHRCTFCSIVG